MNKKKNLSIPRKEDADASDAVFGSAAEEDAEGRLFGSSGFANNDGNDDDDGSDDEATDVDVAPNLGSGTSRFS